MSARPVLVMISGHPGAGKTTMAPALAARLGAVCISREEIANLVFDGWEPRHPALSGDGYRPPTVEGNVFIEGKVSWEIFLAMIRRACAVAPVVAESPFNDERARDRFHRLCDDLDVPVVEVTLVADLATLAARVAGRAAEPSAHPIKQHFTVAPASELLQADFVPVLGESDRVIRQDTTDFGRVDVVELARLVSLKVAESRHACGASGS